MTEKSAAKSIGVIGGMGFAYGGNIGESCGVFEPIHGTAPKYADKNVVNPLAAVLAGAMMVNYLGEADMAKRIIGAIEAVLTAGRVRTYDLGGNATTMEMSEAVAENL